MSIKSPVSPAIHKPPVAPAVVTQQTPAVEAPVTSTPSKKVDLGALGSAFVGVAQEIVNAPAASELNTTGPSQAQRMALDNRTARIAHTGDDKPVKNAGDLDAQRFVRALQGGAAGAWEEAKEPVTQATMGTLSRLASQEGSKAVVTAVKAANAQKSVLPVARMVGETFVESLKTVVAQNAGTVASETGKAVAQQAGKAVASETGKAVAKEAGKAVAQQAGKAVAKEAGKAVAKEAGKAVAQQAGKAVATEGVKAGVVGLGGSIPGIGNLINGAFALVSGFDFLSSLGKSDLSGGEKAGKFVKFASSTVATFLPAGGGLVSLAGGVAGGAMEGAAAASRQAKPTAQSNPQQQLMQKEIAAPNALSPGGGVAVPADVLDSPQQLGGLLQRMTATLANGGADPTVLKAMGDMTSILGSVADASSLTAAQKKALQQAAGVVTRGCDEGLKSVALKAASELRNPDVAAKFGKQAAESAEKALSGLVGMQRMAAKAGATPGGAKGSTALVQQGLQVLGQVAHTAMELTASVA